MKTKLCIPFFFLIFFHSSYAKQSPDLITTLPGFGVVHDVEYAGFLPLTNNKSQTKTGNLFYWYVESRTPSPDVPIVLWLNGGPGAASLYGFFIENGPYEIHKNGTLSKRNYSWTEKVDYLVIDQPAGVGFSYGNKTSYRNETEAMDELYNAINLFFKRHPELASKHLYLAGESYAGKYLPQLAVRILADNTTNKINLKGLIIGDGWVNPLIQQAANIDIAYYHGLIDRHARDVVIKLYDQCRQEIMKQQPSSKNANQVCEKIQTYIKRVSGDLNLANIATGTEPSDTNMVLYLNRTEVREALHIDPGVKKFETFSSMVAELLEVGEQDPMDGLYAQILNAGIPVLVYNGLEDAKDSNFLSTDLWLAALSWPHKQEFAEASTCIWHVTGQVAGYAKTAKGLTQVKIRGAGHIAPVDQPERVLNLLSHFITNQPLC